MRRPPSKDPLLWICAILLWLCGLAGLWSLSRGSSYPIELAQRQLAVGIVGLVVALIAARLSWTTILKGIPWAIAFTAASLVAVLFVGTEINGAARWLSLGPLGSFQPAEFAKLFALLGTAMIACRVPPPQWKVFIYTMALISTLAGLIFLQPDLGTALVLTATCLLLAFIGGLSWPPLALLGMCGAFLLPWYLDEYQWNRIHVFLSPESDPSGLGWNLEQSKIAIGSGGLFGKGAFMGLQGPLDFLPEAHSDFLFSVLAEEYGFLGCCLIALLLTVLVGRLFWHSTQVQHPLRRLVLVGLGLHFAIHGLLNIAMTIGIAPVTGSPLPFVSFGGTALVTNFLAIGLAEAILNSQTFRFSSEPEE